MTERSSTIRELRERRGLHGGISVSLLDTLFDVAEAAEAYVESDPTGEAPDFSFFHDIKAALGKLPQELPDGQ